MERLPIEQALTRLAKALGGEVVHVNWGESDDYMRGFNVGYADRAEGMRYQANAEPPAEEPWHSAYTRGYDAGWVTNQEHEAEAEAEGW